MAAPLRLYSQFPHRTMPPRVNRNEVLLLSIHCARLTRPLAPKIFSKDGARDRVPAEKIPFASQGYFSSGTACHTVCGSQQNFMAVPVSLFSALVLPRQVLLHPAWHGFICTAWRSAITHIHAQTPCCTCSVRREATCSLSYEQTQAHPLPSLVLAREATGCA